MGERRKDERELGDCVDGMDDGRLRIIYEID